MVANKISVKFLRACLDIEISTSSNHQIIKLSNQPTSQSLLRAIDTTDFFAQKILMPLFRIKQHT
jgi:hypothetical protein